MSSGSLPSRCQPRGARPLRKLLELRTSKTVSLKKHRRTRVEVEVEVEASRRGFLLKIDDSMHRKMAAPHWRMSAESRSKGHVVNKAFVRHERASSEQKHCGILVRLSNCNCLRV